FLPSVTYGSGATCELPTQKRIDIGLAGSRQLYLALAQVHFKFFCDKHRHRRSHALSHFRPGHYDRDLVVRWDLDPGVRGWAARFRLSDPAPVRQIEAQRQPTANCGAGLDEIAARLVFDDIHVSIPLLD